MGEQRDVMSEAYPQYLYDPDYQSDRYESDDAVSQSRPRQGFGGFRHTLSLLTDVVVVILGVAGCIWVLGHVTSVRTSSTAQNTGNVVITTGNANIAVSSSQNAPLSLTGSATPLTIVVHNTGTVPLRIDASVSASSAALSSALQTTGNFCLGTTQCASTTNVAFEGSWSSPIVLNPGQTGDLSIMLSVATSGTDTFGQSQAVAVTVGGVQA